MQHGDLGAGCCLKLVQSRGSTLHLLLVVAAFVNHSCMYLVTARIFGFVPECWVLFVRVLFIYVDCFSFVLVPGLFVYCYDCWSVFLKSWCAVFSLSFFFLHIQ